MSAPGAAEIPYLYHSTWVHSEIEQGWVNSCAVIKVRSYCCTRGTHRVTAQRQDWTRLSELMCCDKGKKFLLPSAAETSYLYNSTWVHPALFNLAFEQWHDERPWCSRNLLPLSQHMSSLSLVQSCLLTMTRWAHLVQQKLLTFITGHEFTQPCSMNSCAVIKVRSYCCTRGTHRVTAQRQDWTRLSELMCCDKGKKFLLH
jgi:hypothetical protein